MKKLIMLTLIAMAIAFNSSAQCGADYAPFTSLLYPKTTIFTVSGEVNAPNFEFQHKGVCEALDMVLNVTNPNGTIITYTITESCNGLVKTGTVSPSDNARYGVDLGGSCGGIAVTTVPGFYKASGTWSNKSKTKSGVIAEMTCTVAGTPANPPAPAAGKPKK